MALNPAGKPEDIRGAAEVFPLYIDIPSQRSSVENELNATFILAPGILGKKVKV